MSQENWKIKSAKEILDDLENAVNSIYNNLNSNRIDYIVLTPFQYEFYKNQGLIKEESYEDYLNLK
jgi:hypothetical protein